MPFALSGAARQLLLLALLFADLPVWAQVHGRLSLLGGAQALWMPDPLGVGNGAMTGRTVRGSGYLLGAAIELDLGGRGVRSLELVGATYYVVAGPTGDEGSFALYRWSGRAGDAPERIAVDLGTLRPEALFAIPETASIELASDDGGILVDGRECKKLKRSQQRFRALTHTP